MFNGIRDQYHNLAESQKPSYWNNVKCTVFLELVPVKQDFINQYENINR